MNCQNFLISTFDVLKLVIKIRSKFVLVFVKVSLSILIRFIN